MSFREHGECGIRYDDGGSLSPLFPTWLGMICQIVPGFVTLRHMRWLAILAFSLVLTGSALATGSDEQYLDIYNEILQADSSLQNGHSEEAALRYLQAQTDLQKLHADRPTWNPDIVQFRLSYLAEKLQSLAKYLPATNAPPAAVVAPVRPAAVTPPPAAQPASVTLTQQIAAFQEQIRALTAANAELEGKLKEALSVQPAAANPAELAKAEARIVALEKERDLLTVALDQEKAANGSAVSAAKFTALNQEIDALKARAKADEQKSQEEAARAKAAADESEKKLAAANKELETLKAARAEETSQHAAYKARVDADVQKAMEETTRAKAAADESEKKLAMVTKELELLKTARAEEAGQSAALKARAEADEQKATEDMARLKEAAAESGKMLAAVTKELELLKAAPSPAVRVENAKQIPEEADQLKQQLTEISKDEAEIARLKEVASEAQKKLADANSELSLLKTSRPVEAQTADGAKAVIEERDKLKEELAERSKDLAEAEAHNGQEISRVRAALQQAEKRRDELEKKLAAAPPQQLSLETAAAPSGSTAPSRQLMQQLQARIAVLEANPVPYTAEELALLKKSPAPAPTPAELPKAVTQTRHVYSSKDLPPGVGALWRDALRASMEHNYDTAEQKFNDVLRQDESNVYVLAHLAEAQFAAGHLADCEKSLHRALAVDPNDPACLYMFGLLRYRQDKLEEALDALSLSAKFNPTNSSTQNYLGCVLADKGLRPAAETALRKALQSDPDYADAHFNLAVVYAGNKPPSLELARWHYKRALALGHPKSATVEKALGGETVAPAPAP
jgi:Tfp pilus assembly protein PilF